MGASLAWDGLASRGFSPVTPSDLATLRARAHLPLAGEGDKKVVSSTYLSLPREGEVAVAKVERSETQHRSEGVARHEASASRCPPPGRKLQPITGSRCRSLRLMAQVALEPRAQPVLDLIRDAPP